LASAKTAVIEHLFFVTKGYTPQSGIAEPVVTMDEVVAAIEATNPVLIDAGKKPLSSRNPANFWKDLTRNNLEGLWPQSLLERGWTGKDAIGDGEGACFRFVLLSDGQVAFRADIAPSEEALANVIVLESLSMPLAMKALGRTDENWLAQVGARLRVVETHFAAVSEFGAAEMTFLQTGIKMGQGEVDAAYSLLDVDSGRWLLAVEAKGKRDKIHVPQIIRSAASLLAQARQREQDVVGVLPMALKVIGPSRIYVVEFDPDLGAGSTGTVVAESIIELRPEVPGIE